MIRDLFRHRVIHFLLYGGALCMVVGGAEKSVTYGIIGVVMVAFFYYGIEK